MIPMLQRRLLLSLSVVALFAIAPACKRQAQPPTVAAPPSATQTIVSKKTGKTYAYVRVSENDHELEKFEPPPAGVAAPSPDNFRGTDRKAAKTSISSGPTDTFSDVKALLDSGLFVKDSKMLSHSPPISRDSTSDRVSEEQHNVTVTGFLYASQKESDNDFHCIIGTAPEGTKRYVNVEVSGLPTSGSARAQLKDVRDKFAEFFGDNLPTDSGYSKFTPPIKVRLTGSIFFDIDHKAGVVGPTGMRPMQFL